MLFPDVPPHNNTNKKINIFVLPQANTLLVDNELVCCWNKIWIYTTKSWTLPTADVYMAVWPPITWTNIVEDKTTSPPPPKKKCIEWETNLYAAQCVSNIKNIVVLEPLRGQPLQQQIVSLTGRHRGQLMNNRTLVPLPRHTCNRHMSRYRGQCQPCCPQDNEYIEPLP